MMTLHTYLTNAADRLRESRSIDLFLEMRYHELARLFPHDTFSVGQASLDFFDTALAHLNGEPFAKGDGEPSIYEMNYRKWIKSYKT